jgi:hypothetical protein
VSRLRSSKAAPISTPTTNRTSIAWKVNPHPRAQDVRKVRAMRAEAAIAIAAVVEAAEVVAEADAARAVAAVADTMVVAVAAEGGKASLSLVACHWQKQS